MAAITLANLLAFAGDDADELLVTERDPTVMQPIRDSFHIRFVLDFSKIKASATATSAGSTAGDSYDFFGPIPQDQSVEFIGGAITTKEAGSGTFTLDVGWTDDRDAFVDGISTVGADSVFPKPMGGTGTPVLVKSGSKYLSVTTVQVADAAKIELVFRFSDVKKYETVLTSKSV